MRLLAQRRPDGLVVPVAISGDDGLLRPAGEGCGPRCCGPCWRPADPCPLPFALPEECLPDEPDPIYVSCQVRCQGDGGPGEPVQPGTTFVYNERCWTVRDETIPFEEIPPGATILDETVIVECASGGCLDIRCPDKTLWIVGVPCDPETATGTPPAIPACSIDRCVVYNGGLMRPIGGVSLPPFCYRFDPAHAQDITPGAPALPPPFFEGFADCCECLPLAQCPQRSRTHPCTGETYGPCCCSPEGDRYQLEFVHRWQFWQETFYGEFGGPAGQAYVTSTETWEEAIVPHEPSAEVVYDTTWRFTQHRETTFIDGRPPEIVDNETEGEGAAPGALEDCPPRPDILTLWTISPGPGTPPGGLSVPPGNACRNLSWTIADYLGGIPAQAQRSTLTRADCLVGEVLTTARLDFTSEGHNRWQTSSVFWRLTRIQPTGPCNNGCGNPGIFRKPPQTLPPFTLPDGDLGSGLGGFL